MDFSLRTVHFEDRPISGKKNQGTFDLAKICESLAMHRFPTGGP